MMKRIETANTDLAYVKALQVFLFISAFAIGTYYEYLSAAASVFLLVWLWYAKKKQGTVRFTKSPTVLSTSFIAISFALCALWAVDRGMALFGFVKFLPLPLFAIAVDQLTAEDRRRLLGVVPVSGAAMVVISGALSFFEPFKQFFLVNSRLAGFFEYPNTFAIYLLAGIVILVKNERWRAWETVMVSALLIGIFASGSRTAFVLLVIAVIWLCFMLKGKNRKTLIIASAAIILASAAYVVVSGDVSSIGRYITTSFKTSTFLGRLLYFKDAIPVIASHPFGLGYLGYFSLQGSFQTGVYTVVNVHNELLQLLLDVGWLPAAGFVFAFVKSLKNNRGADRLLLVLIALHSMFDFDMQFPAVGFVLVLAMMQKEEPKKLKLKQGILMPVGILLACVSLYFGAASAAYYTGSYELAAKLYPGYTNAWRAILTSAEDAASMDYISDKILKYNDSDTFAYDAKAAAAYSDGDFAAMIKYKEKAISLSRYELEEYLDYFNMLQVGIRLYAQNNDPESAEYCCDRLLKIPKMLEELEKETSPLAWQLTDKPELTLPDEYLGALESIRAAVS